MAERYSTTREVAERFRTSPATVRYWKHIGKLRGIKPGRHTLYADSELDRFEAKLREEAEGGGTAA